MSPLNLIKSSIIHIVVHECEWNLCDAPNICRRETASLCVLWKRKCCLVWNVHFREIIIMFKTWRSANWKGKSKQYFWNCCWKKSKRDWMFTTPTISPAAGSVFSTYTKDISLFLFLNKTLLFISCGSYSVSEMAICKLLPRIPWGH